MKENIYKNKNIVVIGLARTGLALVEVLCGLGARVTVFDKKPKSELAESADIAKQMGANLRLGSDEVDLTGIDLLVPSPGVPAHLKVFADAQKLGIEVISEIELAYRISAAPIIAITGTNGKTTTTVLTGRMMIADGRNTLIAGNVAGVGEKLGSESDLPPDLQPIPLVLAAYRAKPESVIVAEVSTFQLERISGFKPKIAALLNVSSDHLDRHTSIEEYAALKAKIFEYQDSADFSIINADNPFTASLESRLKGKVLKFSLSSKPKNGAFIDGKDIIVIIDGKRTIACKKKDIRIRGQHNLENVLAACCISIVFGVKPQSIVNALRDFTGVNHRLESFAFIDGVEYINNSMCTNVDAAVRSIEAISEPQIVIAGGKDKGADYRELANAFIRYAKYVVLIGADALLLESAAKTAGYNKITKAESLESAVRIAKSIAQAGDVVVLNPSCASFDMFSSFEDRGNQFKEIVYRIAGEVNQDA